MKLEVWKPIKDFPNYEISNLGNVKGKSRILKPSKNGGGYLSITLFKHKKYTKTIHRLVAKHFLKNTNNFPCINHKNGIKDDNRVENLEWCTYKHNTLESYRMGLQTASDIQKDAVADHCREHKIKSIVQFDLDNNIIQVWKSAIEVQNNLGINRKNISQCLVGNNKTAGGYIWKYEANCYKVVE